MRKLQIVTPHMRMPGIAQAMVICAALVSSAKADQLIWDNGPPATNAPARNISDLYDADDFVISSSTILSSLTFYAIDETAAQQLGNFDGTFGWAVYNNGSGIPSSIIQSGFNDAPTIENTGLHNNGGFDIFSIAGGISPVVVQPGHYWLALREGKIGSPDDGSEVYWQRSSIQQGYSFKSASNLQAPTTWSADPSTNDLSFKINSSPGEITFFDEYPISVTDPGHGFLELTMANGTSQFFGFYPLMRRTAFGPGSIHNDQQTPWNFSISYPVSATSYNSAVALINADELATPQYNLMKFNCVDFIKSIAGAAGLQLPNTAGLFGISDPAAFGYSLSSIGNGNSYQGGTVNFNPSNPAQPTIKPGAAPPTSGGPYDYAYSTLEALGHPSPSTLAATLALPLDQVNLGTANANITHGLSIDLTGADPSDDLISINWGDGSTDQVQSLDFSHVYSPGTYTADVVVVDEGAVHSYDMSILVSSAAGSSVEIGVTAFTSVNIVNPGLITADPALEIPVPEPTAVGIVMLPVVLGCRRRRRPAKGIQNGTALNYAHGYDR